MRNTWSTFVTRLCSLLLTFLSFSLEVRANEVDMLLEPLLSNSSITDTKRIDIPGYPNAYNPSLIPYKGGYLLSLRY